MTIDDEDRLVEAFGIATTIAVELEDVPRWRWLKRRRLEAELESACADADHWRRVLGCKPGAAPMRVVLDEVRAGLDDVGGQR